MAVSFVLTQHPDLKNPAGPKKFYAQAKSTGETTTRELVSHISKRTGLSSADVLAAIEAFIDIVPERIADGDIVRLGEFGSFSLSVSSEGVLTKDMFTTGMIRDCKLNYRPGKLVQNVLDTLEYKKAE